MKTKSKIKTQPQFIETISNGIKYVYIQRPEDKSYIIYKRIVMDDTKNEKNE